MTGVEIRQAIESDAAAFLDLLDALDSETHFMLYEPKERKITLESQKSRLANAVGSENVRILVLDESCENILAGFCAGRRSSNFRDKHVLHIVIGMRQEYTGNRLGGKLLTELEEWALGVGISRLELGVMVHNNYAIALYKRHGFQIEGTKKNSVFLRTGFVDEYIMAKLI